MLCTEDLWGHSKFGQKGKKNTKDGATIEIFLAKKIPPLFYCYKRHICKFWFGFFTGVIDGKRKIHTSETWLYSDNEGIYLVDT